MDITTMPMFRYGEPDFDREYIRWGLHDAATQSAEAVSVMKLLPTSRPLRILDLACGIGRHAVEWAKYGHEVIAVDLSETFIAEGRRLAEEAGVTVEWRVEDATMMAIEKPFDAVVWIEPSFLDGQALEAIHGYLAADGAFIMDVRNPEHAKSQNRNSNWRAWREENGVFYLERHETDPATGLRQSEWIEIDCSNDRATRKFSDSGKPLSLPEKIAAMEAAGFRSPRLFDLEAEPFDGGPEPYWLWLLVRG